MTILVAYSKKTRVIGNAGKIPWKLNNERRKFKEICNGKKVIMGRKTFEEIGHSLPYCTIVIVSKTLQQAPDGCLLGEIVIENNSFFIKLKNGTLLKDDLLIAGGEEIYKLAIPYSDTIYATEINADFYGDRKFPELPANWQKVSEQEINDDLITYNYLVYKKSN